jgi:hypothetical protein
MSYLAHRRKYFQIPGCVAYYTLNEASGDALDSVAGNDGTTSGVTYGATGKIGDAYTFDGVNDYVNIDSALTPLASTTVGTWSCWIKPVDATPAAGEVFISFSDTDSNSFIRLLISSTGVLFAACRNAAGVNQWVLDTDSAVFSDGVWSHVAIVQNGTEIIIYANGVLAASTYITTTDKTVWFSDLSLIDNGRIGDISFNSGGEESFFSGEIDEVALFDTALTAAQITELYNSGTGKTYPF